MLVSLAIRLYLGGSSPLCDLRRRPSLASSLRLVLSAPLAPLSKVQDLCDHHSHLTVLRNAGARGHLDLASALQQRWKRGSEGNFAMHSFPARDSRKRSKNVKEGCGEKTKPAREERGTGGEKRAQKENRKKRGESGGPCRVSGTTPTVLKDEGRSRDTSVEAV